MKNTLTTRAAALFLGVSQSRIRKLIKDGRLAAEKNGRDYQILETDIQWFIKYERKKIGRPLGKSYARGIVSEDSSMYQITIRKNQEKIGNGRIIHGDALEILPILHQNHFQSIIADPPYYQVLLEEDWDNTWHSGEDYLNWTLNWVRQCKKLLRNDGLLFIFGQLGKREHIWLHTCSSLAKEMQFHDMIIWDRAVGYNERYDSFTPQYEMVLVLRKGADSKPYFDKDAVRIQYAEEKIQSYLKDKRYKDKEARERHLRRGKYATNILRVPSLKGSSKEKIGHPSQKPIALIDKLIVASSRKGDHILDPFLGSGTTAASAQAQGRKWTGIESNPEYIGICKRRINEIIRKPERNFD